jgi:hypothetical protein
MKIDRKCFYLAAQQIIDYISSAYKNYPTMTVTSELWVPRSVGEFRKTRHPRNVEFNEVLEICFQGQGACDFQESWTCEASESRTRDFQESWACEVSESRTCDPRESQTGEVTNFGGRKIRESARSLFRKSRTGNSRTSGKQSQSCHPKKSGFGVWTSGRLVNMWDEKTFLYVFTLGIFFELEGVFGM